MREIKVKIEQLDAVRAQLLLALEHARTESVKKILFDKRKASFIRKLAVFEKGLDVLLPNLIHRDYIVVVHYEGGCLMEATYVEVQLCLAHDENEVLMVVSTSTIS